MKIFTTGDIRNAAFIGHGHCGKTSLAEALLFSTGTVARLGSTSLGTATTDYGEDEHGRKLSIRLALAHVVVGATKVNILDTPGFGNFLNDARVGLSVADTAVVVVDAVHGVEVQTDRTWAYAEEMAVPARLFVLNKMDRENADFDRAVAGLVKRFGRRAVAVQVPVGTEAGFRGVVDLVTGKASLSKGDGTAEVQVVDPPDDVAAAVKKHRDALVEMVAETDEALMEKFLEAGTLDEADLTDGFVKAMGTGQVFPIACASATKVVGLRALADLLVRSPAPTARPPRLDVEGKSSRACEVGAPAAFQVFKSLLDPFAGKLSLFRAWSGVVKSDSSYLNVNRAHDERCQGLLVLQGKEGIKVAEVHAGDLACLAKLKDTATGDTLCDKAHPIRFPALTVPDPMMSFAVTAKVQGEEDKITSALHKIGEEDLVLRYKLDPETKELVVSGAGEGHVEAIIERMRDRFKVEAVLHPPRVPYRETITKAVSGSYRHKKQTGGSGQFAEVHMEIKPLTRGGGFEYDTGRVFGGAISNNFFPSIEKGIRQVLERGPVASYHVDDVRCEVYDGKMHPVDSKDIAFQMAGRQLMSQLILQAKPILLEPIMRVTVSVPDTAMGDVMGDLSSRRGRVQGMDADGARQVIMARVPLAEMLTYAAQLKSLTGGRGDFTMEFDHYEAVPSNIQEKIVAGARKHVAQDADDG